MLVVLTLALVCVMGPALVREVRPARTLRFLVLGLQRRRCGGHRKLYPYCSRATVRKIAQIQVDIYYAPRYRKLDVPCLMLLTSTHPVSESLRTSIHARRTKYTYTHFKYYCAQKPLPNNIPVQETGEVVSEPPVKFTPAPQADPFRGREIIVEKAGGRIENFQKTTSELVHAGRRSIENNSEEQLAHFEKLSRILRISRS